MNQYHIDAAECKSVYHMNESDEIIAKFKNSCAMKKKGGSVSAQGHTVVSFALFRVIFLSPFPDFFFLLRETCGVINGANIDINNLTLKFKNHVV